LDTGLIYLILDGVWDVVGFFMLASFVLLTGVFLVFEGFSYLIVYNWDLEVVRLLLMLVLGIIVLSLSFTT
jgi:hypothetical protein